MPSRCLRFSASTPRSGFAIYFTYTWRVDSRLNSAPIGYAMSFTCLQFYCVALPRYEHKDAPRSALPPRPKEIWQLRKYVHTRIRVQCRTLEISFWKYLNKNTVKNMYFIEHNVLLYVKSHRGIRFLVLRSSWVLCSIILRPSVFIFYYWQ